MLGNHLSNSASEPAVHSESLLKQVKDQIARHNSLSHNPHLHQDIIALQSLITTLLFSCFIIPANAKRSPTAEASESLELVRMALAHLPVAFFASQETDRVCPASRNFGANIPSGMNRNNTQATTQPSAMSMLLVDTQVPDNAPKPMAHFDVWMLHTLIWCLAIPNMPQQIVLEIQDTISDISDFVLDKNPDVTVFQQSFNSLIDLAIMIEPKLHSSSDTLSNASTPFKSPEKLAACLLLQPYNASRFSWVTFSNTAQPDACIVFAHMHQLTTFSAHILNTIEWMVRKGSHSIFLYQNRTFLLISKFLCWSSSFTEHSLQMTLFPLLKLVLTNDCPILPNESIEWAYFLVIGITETPELKLLGENADQSVLDRSLEFQNILGDCLMVYVKAGVYWMAVSDYIDKLIKPCLFLSFRSVTFQQTLCEIRKEIYTEKSQRLKVNTSFNGLSDNLKARLFLNTSESTAFHNSSLVRVGWKRRRIHNHETTKVKEPPLTHPLLTQCISASPNSTAVQLWDDFEKQLLSDTANVSMISLKHMISIMQFDLGSLFQSKLSEFVCKAYSKCLELIFQNSSSLTCQFYYTLSIVVSCLPIQSIALSDEWVVLQLPLLPALVTVPFMSNAAQLLVEMVETDHSDWQKFVLSLKHVSQSDILSDVELYSIQTDCIQALGNIGRFNYWNAPAITILTKILESSLLNTTWQITFSALASLNLSLSDKSNVLQNIHKAIDEFKPPLVALRAFGSLGCLFSGTLECNKTVSICSQCSLYSANIFSKLDCSFPMPFDLLAQWINIWCKFASTSTIRDSTESILALCDALGHFMVHSTCDNHSVLNSPCREFLLTFLSHSAKDVRLRASRVILYFAQTPDKTICIQNITVLSEQVLRLARTHTSPTFGDSFITLCGYISKSKYAFESECQVTLLTLLVEYLGNPNLFLRSKAYVEICDVAKSHQLTLTELLQENLEGWSQFAVANLKTNPIISKLLAQLNGVTLGQFLSATLSYTLPPLILNEDLPLIQTIASIIKRKHQAIIIESCGDIIAYLLMHYQPGDKNILERFNAMSTNQITSIHQLLFSCRLTLITNLTMELGNTDESLRIQALWSLKYVESVLYPDLNTGATSEPTSGFMTTFILAIILKINEIIISEKRRPLSYKTKSLASLCELIRLCGPAISSFVPQVVGVLQSALESTILYTETLHCWNMLFRQLNSQELASIFGQAAVILLQIESACSTPQRELMVNLFTFALIDSSHGASLIGNLIGTIPKRQEWTRVYNLVQEHRSQTDIWTQMWLAASSLSNENAIVVQHALERLLSLLSEHSLSINASILDERTNPLLPQIIQQLFETCRIYNSSTPNISSLCCECLGVIGAPDPTTINVVLEADGHFGPKWDIVSKNDAIVFVCSLIEKQLAPSFRATHSTKIQGYLAFTIQELLTYCGFTPDVFQTIDFGKPRIGPSENPKEMEHRDYLQQRWSRFPKSIINTIQPLVGAKYSAVPPLLPPCVYPIFAKCTDVREWIEMFSLDTFSKMQPDYLRIVFQMFSNLIHEGEINLAQLLLPHAVLNVLLSKHRLNSNDMLCEILAVLRDESVPVQSEKYRLCVQVVFKLIDHLTKWIRLKRIHLAKQRNLVARKARSAMSLSLLEELESQIAIVEDWLAQIPQVVTAQASLGCNAYARALMHYEQHVRVIRNSSAIVEMQSAYAELQRIYAQLEDPDSLQGISTLVLSPTLDQQILTHENVGRWADAQTCYELALQIDPENQDYQLGLLRCLQHLGHYETLLTHINGILERNPKDMHALHTQGIEAAWRLGDWPLLERFLSLPHKPGFQTYIGQLLLSINSRQDDTVADLLSQARASMTAFIAAASMESYQRGYDSVLQLSMLNELETMYSFIKNSSNDANTQMVDISKLFQSWDMRLKITFPSYRQREPILSLRRVLLSIVESMMYTSQLEPLSEYISKENGQLWLQTAKDARKAGYFQTAYGATLHAMHFKVPQVIVEQAKLLWTFGQRHQAIWELERAREKDHTDGGSLSNPVSFPGVSQSQMRTISAVGIKGTVQEIQPNNYLRAKTGLLLNRWIEETSGLMSNGIICAYQQISKEFPQWEKCAYYLGRFYNRLREGETEKFGFGSKAKPPQLALQTLQISLICFKQYIKAISYGTKYMYQTMPRLLTLWLDCGNLVLELPPDDERIKKYEALNQHMRRLCTTLPTYQFLTAMPQLVSRISHKNQQVQQVIEAIIVNVMRVFPQQTLWHLMAVGKSTVKSRVRRVTSIFSKLKNEANAQNPSGCNIESLVMEAQKLTDQLLHLCNFAIPRDVSSISMSKDFRTLQRMTPLSMIIPLQSSMNAMLSTSNQSAASHNPFPNDLPTIQGFHDEIEVMSSLQRPRKITMKGSDGKDYIFLCKPVDDLRKDSRLMEFNSMINRLLKKDPDSRKRGLYIRTYAVVPLNEECGIIEWVNNVSGYRHILISSYKAKNLYVHHNEIKQLMERKTPSQEEIFRTIIIPKHPPIFHEWFLETFPEPSKWLASRLTYSTTTAVMSMVGHIVGLGDRHGENILFDELTGACLHVDLNCLFGKGLEFEKPERVPFRLTHNMVDAFGLSGTEGVFRKSCELTLKVLQDSREFLTTILETFLHDPLCEWSKTRGRGALREEPGEHENEKARYILQGISRKLRGHVSNVNAGLSLSIEGQVHELISEATSTKNLSQMYIGWAPFL